MVKQHHERAPPRSQRSRLRDKGYKEYDTHDGRVSFGHSKTEAEDVVKRLRSRGFLARVVKLNHMDGGYSLYVMYKEKGRK
jgi:hypothetical protein